MRPWLARRLVPLSCLGLCAELHEAHNANADEAEADRRPAPLGERRYQTVEAVLQYDHHQPEYQLPGAVTQAPETPQQAGFDVPMAKCQGCQSLHASQCLGSQSRGGPW